MGTATPANATHGMDTLDKTVHVSVSSAIISSDILSPHTTSIDACRVLYCSKHQDHCGFSKSQHSHKRDLHMVVPASLLHHS